MNPDEEAYLNSLIAARHTTKGDTARVVTIPGFADLTRKQQSWIASKIDKLESGASLDTDALFSALQSVQKQREISPSSSESSARTFPYEPKEGLRLEEQSRAELLKEGCPPCYPPGLGFPVPYPAPEPYRDIIQYWKERSGSEDGRVLGAQLVKWRLDLAENQGYYGQRSTQSMQKIIRLRRQRHNVQRATDPDPVRPLDSCDRLQKWIFFQDRQLQLADHLRARLKRLKREEGTSGVDMLSSTRWRLETHEVFLQWVEEQRSVIERELNHSWRDEITAATEEQLPSDEVNATVKIARKPSRATRQSKASPIQASSRVSKRTRAPRQSTGPLQPVEEIQHLPLEQNLEKLAASASALKQTIKRSTRKQDKTETKQTRRTKTTPSASSAKPKGIAKKKAEPVKKSQNRVVTAPAEVRTRSGRISRPPKAWVL